MRANVQRTFRWCQLRDDIETWFVYCTFRFLGVFQRDTDLRVISECAMNVIRVDTYLITELRSFVVLE